MINAAPNIMVRRGTSPKNIQQKAITYASNRISKWYDGRGIGDLQRPVDEHMCYHRDSAQNGEFPH